MSYIEQQKICLFYFLFFDKNHTKNVKSTISFTKIAQLLFLCPFFVKITIFVSAITIFVSIWSCNLLIINVLRRTINESINIDSLKDYQTRARDSIFLLFFLFFLCTRRRFRASNRERKKGQIRNRQRM